MRYPFDGPDELAAVWRQIAQERGVRVADEVLAHDLDLTPSAVRSRRRTGRWTGIDWQRAIEASRAADTTETR